MQTGTQCTHRVIFSLLRIYSARAADDAPTTTTARGGRARAADAARGDARDGERRDGLRVSQLCPEVPAAYDVSNAFVCS